MASKSRPTPNPPRPSHPPAEEFSTDIRRLHAIIDDLRAQNEELRRSQHEIENTRNEEADLFQTAPLPSFVLDREGAIIKANNAGRELLADCGWTQNRRLFGTIFPAESRGAFNSMLQKVFDSKAQQSLSIAPSATKPMTLLLTARAENVQCRIIAVDITELQQHEDNLKDARVFAQSILFTIHEPVMIIDKAMQVIYANPAYYRFFKVRPEDVEHQPFFSIGGKQWDSPDLRNLLSRIIPEHLQFGPFEIEADFGELGHKHLVLGGRRLDQEGGRVSQILLSMQDISDYRQQQRELEERNRELDAFSHSVSHDLRAPLRAISGLVQILNEDSGEKLDEEGRNYLLRVLNNTKKMESLINDMLDLSRVGRAELKHELVNMAELAQEIFEMLRSSEPERNIEFVVKRMVRVHGDPTLLRQVWQNLIANAIKFTSKCPKAKIEVGGKSEGGETVFYVKDNGAGFDSRYAAKLFGVFQRLHSDSEFKGTGVGLAIVKRIIERHGGRTWATGDVGKGACFSFSLPITPPPPTRQRLAPGHNQERPVWA